MQCGTQETTYRSKPLFPNRDSSVSVVNALSTERLIKHGFFCQQRWRVLLSPKRPDRIWSSSILLLTGLRRKAAGAWNWPFFWGKEWMDPYLQSIIYIYIYSCLAQGQFYVCFTKLRSGCKMQETGHCGWRSVRWEFRKWEEQARFGGGQWKRCSLRYHLCLERGCFY